MSALTLEVGTAAHEALLHDDQAMVEFFAWLRRHPDPLRCDTTRLDMLDESGTLFRCTHYVYDENGNHIADGEVCPDGSIHPIDFACCYCSSRSLRQAVTLIATASPLPASALRYFTPSSAEGTPTP